MSAPATSTSLALNQSNLQFGELNLHIQPVLEFKLFPLVHEVRLLCQSAQGTAYKVKLTLMLQTVGKVQQMIEILLSQTRAKFSPPKFKAINVLDKMTRLEFSAESCAEEFFLFYGAHFFPSSKFTVFLGDKNLLVTQKNGADLKDAQESLKTIDLRTQKVASLFLESSDYQRLYVAELNELRKLTLDKAGRKTSTLVDCTELSEWMNPKGNIQSSTKLKENWEKFYAKLSQSQQEYKHLLDALEGPLKSEPFNYEKMAQEMQFFYHEYSSCPSFLEALLKSFPD